MLIEAETMDCNFKLTPLFYTTIFGIFLSIKSQSLTKNDYKISMISSEDNPGSPALYSHGESPVWDPRTQSLYFVDVKEQNVHRLDYNSGRIFTKNIAYGEVNVVALVSGTRRLLVCVRQSIFLLDWAIAGDAALRLLTAVDLGLPDNVINEGKADVQGRFWFGTKGPQTGDDVVPDKATFYSIEQTNFVHPRTQLRPISISNGLAWSLNNTVLYYIDSLTLAIEAFDYDQFKGDLTGRRTIIDISKHGYEDAIPDGLTIDSDGQLWVALMFGGSVLHIDPNSRTIVYGYKLPVSRVTSLIWGGPNYDELFVTTSKDKVDNTQQLSGAIFTIRKTGSRGVPPNMFNFDNADFY